MTKAFGAVWAGGLMFISMTGFSLLEGKFFPAEDVIISFVFSAGYLFGTFGWLDIGE